MKKSFTGKNSKNLVRGAIILIIIGLTFLSSFIVAIPSFAAPRQSYLQNAFNTYCQFYFQDENDSDQAQNTADCKNLSQSLSEFLAKLIGRTNIRLWPGQDSLDDLATSGKLGSIKTESDFETAVKAIQRYPSRRPCTSGR